MASLNYFDHTSLDGSSPWDRIRRAGYPLAGGAENIAAGYPSPQAVMDGWMNSPGHRANLLDPGSREIGLGYYRRGSTGPGYVTQDFGNDAVYAPVIIQNEAISTTSPNVSLYIYDRLTGGGFAGYAPATQMMVSITRNVCQKIFHVQIRREGAAADMPQTRRKARRTVESGGGVATRTGDGQGEDGRPVRRQSPKVGRNDPCPCGSGKKYKKCCGR